MALKNKMHSKEVITVHAEEVGAVDEEASDAI
jgi:hypothetical protein